MSEVVWRLLVDAPEDGARNMAVDEALLDGFERARGAARPILRLYGWRPATLSLGRHQPASAVDAAALRPRGVHLVRRPTGGGAVFHDRERTYAVIGSVAGAPFAGGLTETYRRIAGALVAALRELGVDARSRAREAADPADPAVASCFARVSMHEITAGGRKLVGSAQLRRSQGFLQHGAIPFRLGARDLAAVLGEPVDELRFTDVERALGGRALEPTAIDGPLIGAFERQLGVRLEPSELDAWEAARVEALRCWKYDSAAWTLDGTVGRREACWGPLSG